MQTTESNFLRLALKNGYDLQAGVALPWLTNWGHLNPHLRERAASETIALLRDMFLSLGGDEAALAGKRSGASPRPDLLWEKVGLLIECDETQHFTSERLRTLETYPKSARLTFDLDEYRRLALTWQHEADRYRAAKPTVDFPFPGGRRAQRAYFDACRDLLAPNFGFRVLRVAAPERDATLAFARFQAATALETAA
jgi:hypothetical protein